MGAASEWEEKRCRKIGNEEKKAKQLAEGDFSSFKPRKKGTKGNLYPSWIYVDENTGKIKAFDEEKKLIQRIFNMSEKMGISKIAKNFKAGRCKKSFKWKK